MNNIFKFISATAAIVALGTFSSCNDYLEQEPQSFITPETYLTESSHLYAYTASMYPWIEDLSEKNIYGADMRRDANSVTDDWLSKTSESILSNDGTYSVSSNGGAWSFDEIYDVNYFLDIVIPRVEKGEISGKEADINQAIGEAYFFRAYVYFFKLQKLGDFPIITIPQTDKDASILVEISKRAPRNEVARFILEDLDKAIDLLSETSLDGYKNRLTKNAAKLFKSRVALYEASWLRNFAGTPFVPGIGTGWPGEKYHTDFAYKAGSLEKEVDFLLDEALEAASAVADAIELQPNNMIVPTSQTESNPYCTMFYDTDMSKYEEIIMWKEYSRTLGVTHYLSLSGNGAYNGLSHELVLSFLDKDGYPIYSPQSSLYPFEDKENDLFSIVKDRDFRLQLFFSHPDQENFWINTSSSGATLIQIYPEIALTTVGTGYLTRKGLTPDRAESVTGMCATGNPTFRASEAYLNYIEASYMKLNNETIDSKAEGYWKKLRDRAGINPANDYKVTVAAIDMNEEAKNDWAAYSGGQLITPLEMAIRKERRSELMNEGHRFRDLHRWRSYDQLITKPHRLRGLVVWEGANKAMFQDDEIFGGLGSHYDVFSTKANGSPSSTVSSPDLGKWLFPQSLSTKSPTYNGCTWHMAHYLEPISSINFQQTSSSDNREETIYQNPFWSTTAGDAAKQ